MSDLAYTAVLIGGFAAVALVVRCVGMVLDATARHAERPARRPRSVK